MAYESENQYAMDCIAASVGTALSEDFYTRDYDILIGYEKPFQRICSSFIDFVKTISFENVLKYGTIENFTETYTNKKGAAISEDEQSIIDIIYEQINYNKANNNGGLKEPNNLWKKLGEARRKINLYKSTEELTKSGTYSTNPVTWSDSYYEELQKSMADASISNVETEEQLLMAEDLVSFYKETLDKREQGSHYSWHNQIFDELIEEGPTPGHGGIIGGSTGMGKSTLCLNVIDDLINADVPTIYFPIEMGVENTMDRLASKRTHIPFKEITKLGRSDTIKDARAIIDHEIDGLLAHSNFAIVRDPCITMSKLRSYVKRFQSKLPGNKYCIVFIDLLLMISEFYDGGEGSMAQMIEKAVNKLDILAKELGFHWVGVVQLNRSVETDKVQSMQSIDKLKPTRSAIKNSSALLERARWAITIFRKKYFADLYLPEDEAATIEDIAEIQLMKANDEALGRRYAIFDGPTFTITPMQDERVA